MKKPNKVLVIGGGRRVGAEITKWVSQTWGGNSAFYTSTDENLELSASHCGMLDITGANNSWENFHNFVHTSPALRYGLTDVIVCASPFYWGDSMSIKDDQFARMVDMIIHGTRQIINYFTPILHANSTNDTVDKTGSITFLVDTAAVHPLWVGYEALGACRAAQMAIIKQSAVQSAWSSVNVNINAIAAGYLMKPNVLPDSRWNKLIADNTPLGEAMSITSVTNMIYQIATCQIPVSGSIIEMNGMEHLYVKGKN